MNSIINYNYNLVNIVWIDRGIKIAIIYNLLKYYNKIKNKYIIIENKDYRYFSKKMFPELKFKKYKKNDIKFKKNFYFNIKNILIKKDIFIDSIYNYIDKNIPAKDIYVIPWFDINDPIISFRYTRQNKLIFTQEINKIIYLGNYNRIIYNKLWDNIIEYNIIEKYRIFKNIANINSVYYAFFSLLKNYYMHIDKPQIYNITTDTNNHHNQIKQSSSKDTYYDTKNDKNYNNTKIKLSSKHFKDVGKYKDTKYKDTNDKNQLTQTYSKEEVKYYDTTFDKNNNFSNNLNKPLLSTPIKDTDKDKDTGKDTGKDTDKNIKCNTLLKKKEENFFKLLKLINKKLSTLDNID